MSNWTKTELGNLHARWDRGTSWYVDGLTPPDTKIPTFEVRGANDEVIERFTSQHAALEYVEATEPEPVLTDRSLEDLAPDPVKDDKAVTDL